MTTQRSLDEGTSTEEHHTAVRGGDNRAGGLREGRIPANARLIMTVDLADVIGQAAIFQSQGRSCAFIGRFSRLYNREAVAQRSVEARRPITRGVIMHRAIAASALMPLMIVSSDPPPILAGPSDALTWPATCPNAQPGTLI
jgi:hypothetical protein